MVKRDIIKCKISTNNYDIFNDVKIKQIGHDNILNHFTTTEMNPDSDPNDNDDNNDNDGN